VMKSGFFTSKGVVVSIEFSGPLTRNADEDLPSCHQVECKGCQVHNLNCETGGAVIQGFFADGMFAEYAAIDYRNAIHLPEELPMNDAAPVFCAGITGELMTQRKAGNVSWKAGS